MNDELDRVLKEAQVPERSPGYWKHFPKRVTAQLGGPRSVVAASWRWWWIAGMATACVVTAILIRPRQETPTNYAKLYREISTMFPNQVQAIVVDDAGVQLVLSEEPNVPASAPIVVRACEPARCRSFITFSGQELKVDGDTWDVLVNAQNKVIVAGHSTQRYRIEARLL